MHVYDIAEGQRWPLLFTEDEVTNFEAAALVGHTLGVLYVPTASEELGYTSEKTSPQVQAELSLMAGLQSPEVLADALENLPEFVASRLAAPQAGFDMRPSVHVQAAVAAEAIYARTGENEEHFLAAINQLIAGGCKTLIEHAASYTDRPGEFWGYLGGREYDWWETYGHTTVR